MDGGTLLLLTGGVSPRRRRRRGFVDLPVVEEWGEFGRFWSSAPMVEEERMRLRVARADWVVMTCGQRDGKIGRWWVVVTCRHRDGKGGHCDAAGLAFAKSFTIYQHQSDREHVIVVTTQLLLTRSATRGVMKPMVLCAGAVKAGGQGGRGADRRRIC